MSPKTKSVLLLLATLVIGLILGALMNGYFVRQRLDHIGGLMNPAGFGEHMEEVIQPTSDEQREAIRKILDSAAPKAIAAMRESRAVMRALNDSVKAELANILTDEQMKRLDDRTRFRRRGPFQPGLPPMLDDSTGRRPRGEGRRRRFGNRPPPPPRDSMDFERPPPPPPPGG